MVTDVVNGARWIEGTCGAVQEYSGTTGVKIEGLDRGFRESLLAPVEDGGQKPGVIRICGIENDLGF